MNLFDLQADNSVNPARTDYNRPTLIFFGGKGMIADRETDRDVAGHLLFLHRILGRKDVHHPDIHIVAAIYPYSFEEIASATRVMNDEATLKGYCDSVAFQFVKQEFLPLIMCGPGFNGSISGNRRPLENIRRSFGNIRIVTHSFGGAMCEQVGNALVHCMKMAGFDEPDIKEATREIVVLKIGSTSSETKSLANFTQISFLHDNDLVIQKRSSQLEKLRQKRAACSSASSLFVSSHHDNPNDITVYYDRIGSDGNNVYTSASWSGHWVNPDGQLCKPGSDKDAHGFNTYLSPKPNSLLAPLMMQTIIARALDHSIANADPGRNYAAAPNPRALMRVTSKPLFKQAPAETTGIFGDPEAIAGMINYDHRIDLAFKAYEAPQIPEFIPRRVAVPYYSYV